MAVSHWQASIATRLYELVDMLGRASGPDQLIDLQIGLLLSREIRPSGDMNEAMKLVRVPIYQWGVRWHENGEWSAYVEQRSALGPWALSSHASAAIALSMAALTSRANELAWPLEE